TANPEHPHAHAFSLQFARLSPYAIMEILDLSDAQQERFLRAYDIAKHVLRELGVFPEKGNAEQERFALELDEFERGYPRLTLALTMDVIGACLASLEKTDPHPISPRLQNEDGLRILMDRVRMADIPKHPISWRALLGKLSRMNRLKVFDSREAQPLRYKELL